MVARLESLQSVRIHGDFLVQVEQDGVCLTTQGRRAFQSSPTTDWRVGGPIIERNDISVEYVSGRWRAHLDGTSVATGSTVLEAAMRTRVKMSYGETVAIDKA
jgi:hypothetical protein